MPQGGASDVQVVVQTPSNEQLKPTTRMTNDGLRVDWTPNEVGTYLVHVTFSGNIVPGSPFRVKCYDYRKVLVTPPTGDSAVRKPTRFLSELIKNKSLFLYLDISQMDRNIEYLLKKLNDGTDH